VPRLPVVIQKSNPSKHVVSFRRYCKDRGSNPLTSTNLERWLSGLRQSFAKAPRFKTSEGSNPSRSAFTDRWQSWSIASDKKTNALTINNNMPSKLAPFTKTIIELYTLGKTCREIAARFKTLPENVRYLLKQNNIKMNPSNRRKGLAPWNKGLKQNLIQISTELIETGKYKKLSEQSIRKHVKRYLTATTGHKCSICHTTSWNNQPVPLICDHIDGNSANSDLNNFRLVCCNCDAQLPTYKSKNRGRGRIYDKAYYHKTKEVARLVEDTHLK